MLKSIIAFVVATSLYFSSMASHAQDCTSPIVIHNETGITGDTCTAGNPLPTYGGTGSPQNEVVYSFVYQGSYAVFSIAPTGGYEGSTPMIFLLPACTPSTDPIGFGAPGVNLSATDQDLTQGVTYFLVATADPGGPNDACGQYSLFYFTTPVTLQSFSID